MKHWLYTTLCVLTLCTASIAAMQQERLVPEITIDEPAQDMGKVFVVPPPGADDFKNINETLAKALAAGPGAKVVFQNGTYDLGGHPNLKPPSYLGGQGLRDNVDAHPDVSGAHLYLKDVADLIIDGQGATLLMHPSNTFLEMDGCQRVEVKNFTLNYTMPHHMQGDIVEVAAEALSFTVKPHAGYPYSAGFPKTESPVKLSEVAFILDPVRNQLKRPENLDGPDQIRTAFVRATYEVDEDTHRVRYAVKPRYKNVFKMIEVGDRIATKATYGSNFENMLIKRSSDCLIENITAHTAGDMNIRPANNEGPLVFRRIINKIKPNSDHIVSTIKDGIHCRSNRGPILIEQCYFGDMMDDSINIFVLGSVCNEVTKDGALKVGRDDYGEPWDFYRPGDTVAFLDARTEAYLATRTVKSVIPQHADKDQLSFYYTLSFTEPLPNTLVMGKKGDLAATQIFNISASGAGSVIRNNVFKTQRRHALLISAPNTSFVNNIVDGIGGSAVHGGTQGAYFVCGPMPTGMIIRDNAIRDTGMGAIILHAGSTADKPGVENSPMQNILIEDNDIQLKRYAGLRLFNLHGVQIKDNTITVLPDASPRAKSIEINRCTGVDQQGNQINDQ
jgi:hypothetical protein